MNRAGLLYELGDADAAWEALTVGLRLVPGDAHLLCLNAQLLAERDELEAATQAASAALSQNPKLAEAWAIRGELAYRAGDLLGAVTHLDWAIELADRPTIRFNRAIALRDARRYVEAAADYEAVVTATGDVDAYEGLRVCRAKVSP